VGRPGLGQPGRHERGSDEFNRVVNFSDALFPIAMTLLVVGIEIPDLSDSDSVGELADVLSDDIGSFVSFVISFAVIGRYWVAHHSMFSRLAAVDGGLIGINLVYLMFIAFLPFPTGLLGNYFENPLSIVTYALAVGAVSGMEFSSGTRSAGSCSSGRCRRTSTAGVSGSPSHPCWRS
jgi:uncharacterized membrane protein